MGSMGRDERRRGEPAGQQSVGNEEGKETQSGGENREEKDGGGRRGYLNPLAKGWRRLFPARC